MKKYIAAIGILAVGTALANAAEIRTDPTRDSGVILEGRIEAGDFEKLRSVIFGGDGAQNIFLASPGGDLAEAMRIGRLVRELKLTTSVPDKLLPASRGASNKIQKDWLDGHKLKEVDANYTCASACFFVFVAGIRREVDDPFGDQEAILGIHRPYLSVDDLRGLSSDRAIAATTKTRAIVEDYLKEMGVPAKYADQMFSVPKDQIRWINNQEFEADFKGFIPGLKEWVDARCDKRTDIEKKIWEEVKDKAGTRLSTAEKAMTEVIMGKLQEREKCETEIQSELALRAYRDVLERRVGSPKVPHDLQ